MFPTMIEYEADLRVNALVARWAPAGRSARRSPSTLARLIGRIRRGLSVFRVMGRGGSGLPRGDRTPRGLSFGGTRLLERPRTKTGKTMRARPGLDAAVVLHGEGIYLRYPDFGDYEVWAAVREESRQFLEPWEPVWPSDDLSKSAFRRRVRRYHREIRDDYAYPFFLFRAEDDALMGALTLSNVRRGVAQTVSLGYWLGQGHTGKGHMSQSVHRLTDFVFRDLRLHRIEAACIPTNEPSQKVLRRCGFREEGLARGYLKINGRWQDHLLFALLEDDPRPERWDEDRRA